MSNTRAALARTYRPRKFAEMATQRHVSETLRSAVARGRTAHAYLFCGPRGVGKTTAARVLAMALNCPNRAPDGEPCGECDSCQRIWWGRTSLDVIEIDAASNRGVDDARDLRERAMYAPTAEDRFKVYIIDEAHMLTREAWNALLKILEEPPPRVIFVFATTEPQKIQQIAPPILSRCQRFDFRRIAVTDIVNRLRVVLQSEGVLADDDALLPVARRAEGGLRDALSVLDQVLSFTEGRITAADVRQVLGVVGEELYVELFEILADRRYGDVFRFVQRLLDEGYDLTEFYRGLADALRAMLVCRFDGPGDAEVRDDLRESYAALAERFGTGDLLRMLSLVAELDTEGRFRKSANPRTMLEALLLRFAYLDRTVQVEALIAAAGGRGPSPGESPNTPAAEGKGRARLPDPAAGTARTADTGKVEAAAGARGDPAATAAVGTGSAARDALRAILEHRQGLPDGISIFLKAATIAEAGEGRIVLEVPPGPALEKLATDASTREAVRRALATELDTPIELEVRAPGANAADPAPVRLTAERVRAERLARLSKDQPALDQAIRELDLELFE